MLESVLIPCGGKAPRRKVRQVIPAEAVPPGMLEHPHYPGVFYDASLVYIRTGDVMKDAAHRLMMHEHSYSIPQAFIVGAAEALSRTPSNPHVR